jgi:uncharacterized protein YukE
MSIFSFEAAIADQAVNLINTSQSQTQEVLGDVVSKFGPINDGAWIGKGAEAFKNEVLSEVIPGLSDLIQYLQTSETLAREIAEEIHAADDFLSGLFGFVEDVFDAITPW